MMSQRPLRLRCSSDAAAPLPAALLLLFACAAAGSSAPFIRFSLSKCFSSGKRLQTVNSNHSHSGLSLIQRGQHGPVLPVLWPGVAAPCRGLVLQFSCRPARPKPLPSAAAPQGGPLTAMPTISRHKAGRHADDIVGIASPDDIGRRRSEAVRLPLRPGPACRPGAAQPTVKASLDASLRRRSTGTRTGGRRAGREPDQGFILADVDVEHEKEGSRSARREALKGRRNRKERRSSGLNDPARPAPARPAAAARFRSGPAEKQTQIGATSTKGFYSFQSAA